MEKLLCYPVPMEAVLIEDYIVKVKDVESDIWQTLPCYKAKVDMHEVREASIAYFDFEGKVDIEITCSKKFIYKVDIRPLAQCINEIHDNHSIQFSLDKPINLSIEVNGDRFHNLHLFADAILSDNPDINDQNVKYLSGNLNKPSIYRMEEIVYELEKMRKGRTLYFGPGIHYIEECTMRVPSDTNIFITGGAIVVGTFICSKVKNIRIFGRGVLYLANFERFSGLNGIRLSHAQNITIEGIILINPPHYTIYIGGSDTIKVSNIKAFSCEGWSDGIDMMSSQNIIIDNVFLRTSDDSIAIYGRRWDYNGDMKNVVVKNSVVWADVAHPLMIGTHGDYEHDGNVIENIRFENIDILEHHEAQPGYLGCMAINVGDKNTARNISYENIRVEQFEHGALFDIQVKYNPDYNPAPGKRIENVTFKNIYYNGIGEVASQIRGYSTEKIVTDISFENLVINGQHILKAEDGNIKIGEFAENITFK